MPFFEEGQDPLNKTPGGEPGRMPMGPPEPDPFAGPSIPDTINAAFRLNNPVVSVLDAITRSRPDTQPVEGYDPIPEIVGSKYEPFASEFLADRNPAQTASRKAKIDSEQHDQQTLAASGFAGTVASLVAGATDPSWFIPIVGELKSAREGVAAGGVLARAARGAVEGFGQSVISEAGLQGSQDTRTLSEGAADVATNTLLMGLIGGGMGWLLPGERVAAFRGLDDVRGDLSEVPQPREAENLDAAINAYHGTAHQFVQFMSSKMGSGEGTQAFGSGMYFAERRRLAEYYRQLVSGLFGERDPTLPHEPSASGDDAAFDAAGGKHRGALYSVQILANREHMLDWDVPFEQQPPRVQAALSSLEKDHPGITSAASGKIAHDLLGGGTEAAKKLEGAGIPGIQFLDAKSRPFGKGTHNFVVFNDKNVIITHRNDEPILDVALREAGIDPSQVSGAVRDKTLDVMVRDRETHPLDAYQKAVKELTDDARNHAAQNAKLGFDDTGAAYRGGARVGEVVPSGASRSSETSSNTGEVAPAPLALASSLSAAASDKRDMQLARIGLPMSVQDALRSIPGAGAALDFVTAANMRLSPTLRVFSSDSLVAKRAMGDMAETALRFTQSERGVPTAQGGVPLDRLLKIQEHELTLTNSAILRDKFLAYRGAEPGALAMQKVALADSRGQAAGKMTFADFKTQVTLAGSSGDVHSDPHVQAAIREIRTKVLDPVMQLAQRVTGPDGKPMLSEALEPPKGDKSFFPRQWNKQALAAKRNDARRVFADWLQSEQAQKAASKDRIADAQAKHEKFANMVDKLDHRMEINANRMSDTASKLKERASETNRATDRVDTLDERNAKIDASVQELEEFLAETKSVVQSRDADAWDREAYDNLKRQVAALKRSKGRNEIRLNEAGVPVSASQSRFMDLADRMTRQQVMGDLLEHARANAEADRLRYRAQMEDEIRKWKGDASADTIAALKARDEAERIRGLKQQAGVYKGQGERLTSADGPVDRAVKRILASDRDLSREDLESRAAEIVDRINSAPDGRLPYDAASGGPQMGPPSDKQQVRGSLNARDFAIPTSLVKDFVHTDAEHIVSAHLRTALPDIHITDRFGDVEMQDVFRRLNEEYDNKAKTLTSERALTALDNERKAMNRDLAATRDRLRHTYGWELAKTQPNAARIANAARNYNMLADLGTSVFNRLTDSVNAIYRHGFMNVMADGYMPFFKGLVGMEKDFLPAARTSMHDLGVGVDSAIGHLSHQFGDVIANYLPSSKFERGLSWTADKSMILNLHGPWTDGIKTIAGTVSGANLLRTAEKVTLGTASEKEIAQLAQSGIEPVMAERIWKAFKGEGGGQTFGDRTHVANTASWSDAQARGVFASAVGRDADMSVLTPGLEKPLWMSGPVVSLLGQYKSFIAAAHEKLLISNLQQMDARTLQGLAASLGMGMLSYRAYTLLGGTQASDRPQDWIKEGISRSAILGWFSEINSMQAKFTGGKTDMFQAIGADHPLSRRSSNGALSEMLGPTYSKLEGIAGGINDLSHGTWTAMDTHKMRQAMILQNVWAIRRLFDHAEDGFNEHLGIKPLDRTGKPWPGAPAR